MKGKKGILLILLVVVLGLVTWQFVLKKKPKTKKAPKPKPPIEQPAAPETQAATPAPELPAAPPGPPGQPAAPPPAPPGQPPPPSVPGMPQPPPPGAPPAQVPPGIPTGLPGQPSVAPPGSQIPKAQQVGTETQPLISLVAGPDLRLAEGTTLLMAEVKVDYQGKRTLRYHWELVSGPDDKIDIQGARDLKARITLGNLEQAEDFIIQVRVTDGLTEATDQILIEAFPAELTLVAQVGGAWMGVTHMGDKWVAGRGRQLEVFGSDFTSLAQINLDFPIAQFFAIVDGAGKGAIFAQGAEGTWVVAQQEPGSQGSRVSRLPMLGRKIHHMVPFRLDGQPYSFALLEKNIELWNLSDPRRPKLKTSLLTQLRQPRFLAFQGRHLYVADEQSIQIINFSTGQAIASVPSGGSITSLETYNIGKKPYLLAAIGKDRTGQNRKDYGLRLFEIDSGGRLGQEKRITVGAGDPVKQALVIPGVQRALLTLLGEQGIELKMFDLASRKVLPLNFSSPPNFLALDAIATGKLEDNPVAVVADGNQLRVFAFQGTGGSYNVEQVRSFPGLMSANWVANDGGGSKVWVGDEGTPSGGSLSLVAGADLQILKTFNSAGLSPVDVSVPTGSDTAVLLYVTSNPKALEMDSPEGELGILNLRGDGSPARSKPFLGIKNAQGELRPLGVNARGQEGGLQIAVAIARVAGALGGSGIALFNKGADQGAGTFLNQDLKAVQTLIPLQDARDVGLSPDGKAAFLASGAEGVLAVDLEKKTPASRMSLGKQWFADRILVGHGGQIILASFIEPTRGQVIVKVFGVGEKLQLQEYGTIQGLKAIKTLEGLRAPRLALTPDDLYLFVPLGGRLLAVLNMSNPAQPFKVTEVPLPGEVRGVSLANRFQDIFVALGPSGLAKLKFGFAIPLAPETPPEADPGQPETQPETQPLR